MKLFDIGTEFRALYDLAETIEYDENGKVIDNSLEIAGLFGEIESELKNKLDNVQYIIKELEVSEIALKDEAKRINEKAKVLENRKERLKNLIKTVLAASGETKVKTEKFNFCLSFRQSFNYDDVNLFALDNEFKRVKEELDKTKIKEFIKAGGVIDGLKITDETTLTIR